MKRFIYLCYCLLALGLCSSCKNDVKTYHYCTSKEHTLLVYMVGDNNLNKWVNVNLDHMRRGLRNSDTPVNLVIYVDCKTAKNDLPQLYQLKRRENSPRIDTVFIKRWDKDINSTDPEVIAEVVSLTFKKFDTEVKGLEFWSHGLSWIPSDAFQREGETRIDTRTPQPRTYIGWDDNNQGDIWNVRKALEKSGVHLDYMMFDACHMATAEVAYELSGVTDYILASCTEIDGQGFPYENMIKSLSTINSKPQVETGLVAAMQDYQTVYKKNGTFGVLRTAGFASLLEACLDLEMQTADLMEQWEKKPYINQLALQQYGRFIATGVDNSYLFYDIEDWCKLICEQQEGVSGEAVYNALQQCVVDSYHSAQLSAMGEDLIIRTCCGVAMSIPLFWSLSNQKKLDEAYSQLKWNIKIDNP